MTDLESLFATIDQAFAQVAADHQEEVRCGRGCDDCCHAVFDVSLVEAVAVRQAFDRLDEAAREAVRQEAVKALAAWQALLAAKTDLAVARIRCPLLDDAGSCRCYAARPVNCRTYGIPTVIQGKAHVCGLSGFEPGKSYPVIRLEAIQQALYGLSCQLGGEGAASRRWPVAAVLLGDPEVDGLR
ncbi:MAG: YkgJ family cysteine cluster protein [Thermodesulfobacteriota bacterium]